MIALYPGAYKPPHRGHFNVVKSLLDGSYSGAIYSKDDYKEKGADLLGGVKSEKPKIDKVIYLLVPVRETVLLRRSQWLSGRYMLSI